MVVTTGFFDRANMLNVPGADLPKVTHYYREPYPYAGQRVIVHGAAGAVGSMAAQLGREAGTYVIGTVTQEEGIRLLHRGVAVAVPKTGYQHLWR